MLSLKCKQLILKVRQILGLPIFNYGQDDGDDEDIEMIIEEDQINNLE